MLDRNTKAQRLILADPATAYSPGDLGPSAFPGPEEAARAWELHRLVVAVRDQIEALGLDLARALYEIHTAGLFRLMGYESFNAYLGSPEITISRAWAYRLITTWRGWGGVVERAAAAAEAAQPAPVQVADLVAMGTTKQVVLAPLVRNMPDEDVAQVIADTRDLSVSDTQAYVQDRRGARESELGRYLRRVMNEIGTEAMHLPTASQDEARDRLSRIVQIANNALSSLEMPCDPHEMPV